MNKIPLMTRAMEVNLSGTEVHASWVTIMQAANRCRLKAYCIQKMTLLKKRLNGRLKIVRHLLETPECFSCLVLWFDDIKIELLGHNYRTCRELETYNPIGLAVRVFSNGSGDLGSIPGRVIPKTQKMVLDASLLNTQHYKVRIKGKVEQSRERSSALPYTLV